MKKLNRSILRKINQCIALILSLLGIVACNKPIEDDIYDTLCMYGVPLEEFKISGRVENKLGEGISNIKISSIHQEPLDTTNSDGSFNFSLYEPGSFGMDLVFQDIDSIENGHYKTKTIYYSSGTNDLVITLEEQEQNNNEENDNE